MAKEKFIKMFKPGEEPIEVNPSVVEDHKRLGWKVVGEPQEAAAGEPEADTTPESEGTETVKGKRTVRKRVGKKGPSAETESGEGK